MFLSGGDFQCECFAIWGLGYKPVDGGWALCVVSTLCKITAGGGGESPVSKNVKGG